MHENSVFLIVEVVMSIQKVSNFNGMAPAAYNSKSNVAFGSVKLNQDKSLLEFIESIPYGPEKQRLKNALWLLKSNLSQLPKDGQDGILTISKMPEETKKLTGENLQLQFSNGKKIGFFYNTEGKGPHVYNDVNNFNADLDVARNLMNTYNAIA